LPKTRAPLQPLSLREVLDAALRASGLKTYDSLARRMGVSPGTVYQWAESKRLPSDDMMLVLAAMADIWPMEALLLLNHWRATGRAKNLYMKWLQQHGYHHYSRSTQQIVQVPDDKDVWVNEVIAWAHTIGEQIHTK
jgi:transcriptional regulator with XRE-family HTH domain